MTTSAIIWAIVGGCYFLGVSATVFAYFSTSAQPREREFWTILITWILSLLFGPFIFLAAGVVGVRKIFFRKKK